MLSRRYFLGVCSLALTSSVAGCGGSDDPPADTANDPGDSNGGDNNSSNDDSSGDTVNSPQANFSFDYGTGPETSMDGEVAISHVGGDSILSENLYIRGENLAQTGNWTDLGGGSTGTVEGDPAVVTADSVFVEADTDFVVRVVWSTGDTSEVLAQQRGPDA